MTGKVTGITFHKKFLISRVTSKFPRIQLTKCSCFDAEEHDMLRKPNNQKQLMTIIINALIYKHCILYSLTFTNAINNGHSFYRNILREMFNKCLGKVNKYPGK